MALITPNYSQQSEDGAAPDETASPPAEAASEPQVPLAHDDGSDREAMAIRQQFGIKPAAAPGQTPVGGAPVVPKKTAPSDPTFFHQAGTPAPAGAPSMSWEESLKGAAYNAIPSAFGAAKALGTAVVHPIDTISSVGDLVHGLVSKAAGSLGMQQDPVQKAKNERVANAMIDHYKQVYGSEEGLKKAIHDDPTSIFMDALTALGGVGAVAKGASSLGLISETGAAAKWGERAAAAAAKYDPVGAAVGVAKKVAGAPAALTRYATAKTSGLLEDEQKAAYAAGKSADPAIRQTYKEFSSGPIDPVKFQKKFVDAISGAKKAGSDYYLQKKGSLAQGPVDISNAEAAIDKHYNDIASTSSTAHWDGLDDARKEVQNRIDAVKADKARQGVDGIDALKQQLGELRGKYTGKAQALVDNAYANIRQSLINKDPEYATLMEEYDTARRASLSAMSATGAGNRVAANAALAKTLRSAKTASGKSLIEDLAQHDPTIPAMVAGAAANPAHAGTMKDLFDAAVSAGLFHLNPALSILPALGASPHLVGGANYYAGRAAGAVGRATAPITKPVGAAARAIGPKGGYYAGRVNQEDDQSQQAPPPAAGGPTGSTEAPRSIRNNNHGNLIDGDMARSQPGYTGSDGHFAQFDTPEHGAAAADHLLQIKAQQGLDTPEKLIHGNGQHGGWAPDAGPDYPAMIAQALGIGPNDRMDLSDPTVRAKVHEVIGRFEAGSQASSRGGRASGGKVDRHEELVGRLMRKADEAKRATNKTTEPLLKAPDEAIVRALDVAQQAI